MRCGGSRTACSNAPVWIYGAAGRRQEPPVAGSLCAGRRRRDAPAYLPLDARAGGGPCHRSTDSSASTSSRSTTWMRSRAMTRWEVGALHALQRARRARRAACDGGGRVRRRRSRFACRTSPRASQHRRCIAWSRSRNLSRPRHSWLRAERRGLELPEETLGFLTRRAPRDFATLCRMLDALDIGIAGGSAPAHGAVRARLACARRA